MGQAKVFVHATISSAWFMARFILSELPWFKGTLVPSPSQTFKTSFSIPQIATNGGEVKETRFDLPGPSSGCKSVLFEAPTQSPEVKVQFVMLLILNKGKKRKLSINGFQMRLLREVWMRSLRGCWARAQACLSEEIVADVIDRQVQGAEGGGLNVASQSHRYVRRPSHLPPLLPSSPIPSSSSPAKSPLPSRLHPFTCPPLLPCTLPPLPIDSLYSLVYPIHSPSYPSSPLIAYPLVYPHSCPHPSPFPSPQPHEVTRFLRDSECTWRSEPWRIWTLSISIIIIVWPNPSLYPAITH